MLSFTMRAALAALLLSAPAAAQTRAGDIVITDARSRETPPLGKVGAAYLTLTNTGKSADRFLGGSTPAAAELQIHEVLNTDGVMRMRQLEQGLALPPGQTVKAAPGGIHLMLMGLKRPLKAGATVPVTLRFERAGPVAVTFKVVALDSGRAH